MKVILFHIGNYAVHSYGLIIALAMILGIGVGKYLAKDTIYKEKVEEVAFWSIVGALIGARVWQVLFFEWSYYSQHLGEIIAIWNGGLSIQGGLVGGIVGVILYTRKKKLDFWKFADILAPAVIFAQGVGRDACFLNGDAFGSPTNLGYGIVYAKDTMAYQTYGSQPLFPAEVWEGQMDILIFALLLMLKGKERKRGFIFLSYNILYSIGRFCLEMLRGDSPRFLFNWTAAQWTSVIVIVLSIIFMIFLKKGKEENGKDPFGS